GVLATGWILFTTQNGDFSNLGSLFLMATAASWAVLIPGKLWIPGKLDDSWTRRLVQMTLGFGVAVLGLWLEGYPLPWPWTTPGALEVLRPWPGDANVEALRVSWMGRLYGENLSMPVLACYISYFGLMFLVLRWWRLTDTNRSKRFALLPVI